MGTISRKVGTILGVGRAPGGTPVAGIRIVGIIGPGRVIAFYIGKVKKDLVISPDEVANLVISEIKISAGACPVSFL